MLFTKNKHLSIIILSLILFYELNFSFLYPIHKKHIFSFWEPKDKIPGLLQLCIKTWKKFFPDYEIIILDYEKTKKYLGEPLFSNIICDNMTVQIKSDAIRVALLKKYGGIWLDTDTIILNRKFIEQFQRYELAMIGEKNKYQYIGFIYASKKSSLLDEWLKQIIQKVKKYKSILSNINSAIIRKNNSARILSKFYLGYDIINSLLMNKKGVKYYRLDSKKIKCFPERIFAKNISMKSEQLYKEYYFKKGDPEIIINNSKGLILLHNSWTPLRYKRMSESAFLKQDILLSKLFLKLLK